MNALTEYSDRFILILFFGGFKPCGSFRALAGTNDVKVESVRGLHVIGQDVAGSRVWSRDQLQNIACTISFILHIGEHMVHFRRLPDQCHFTTAANFVFRIP
jgi:hypothetical protein